MFRKIRSFIRGWAVLISGKTPHFTRDRLKVCRPCEYQKWMICTKCGCPLHAKTRSEEEYCPEKRWDAIVPSGTVKK